MKYLKQYFVHIVFIAIFIAVISKNFIKPFGFFRESNAALVCINATVWNKHSNILHDNIPVNSYAFLAYTNPEQQLYNTTITFGNWWVKTPYYFFKIFNAQPNEISIRIFSLCWLLLTLLIVFLLTKSIVSYYNYEKTTIQSTLILYIFSPAVLWYNIQGYVHEIAVLPFYFLTWLFFLKFIKEQSLKWLLLLGLSILLGVQYDWLPFFQSFVISFYLILIRRKIQLKWAFTIPLFFLIAGIAIFLYQYISWAGLPVYINYMKAKFDGRTIGSGKMQVVSFINHNFNIVLFYCISIGITLLIFLFSLIKRKQINPLLLLMFLTAFLHHTVFWGFSNEHDHSVIKMLYPIVFTAALMLQQLDTKKIYLALMIVLVINISQYFILHNYPLRKGIYANENYCYELGNFVKENSTDNNEMVFIDTEEKYFSQIEFYAGKYYVLANNIAQAKDEFLKRNLCTKGCFIEMKNNKILITRFEK